MSATEYRRKLLNTFWLTANKAGVNQDDARAFAQSVYPGKRLSQMTVDELERVTKEFINIHRVDVRMPAKRNKRQRSFNWDNRLERATSKQIDLIDNYAEALGLQDFHLEKLMYRAGAKFGEPLTLKVAQNMIEGMKKMLARNWKPKKTKEPRVEHVTWH